MKRLGILISAKKPKKIQKSVSEWAEEIAKAGTHKYLKREGSPGNYTYYYRLPNGKMGTKDDLKPGSGGKKVPPEAGSGGKKVPEKSPAPQGKGKGSGSVPKAGAASGGAGSGNGGDDGNGSGKGPKVTQGDTISGKDAYTGQEVNGVVTAMGKDGITITNDQGIQHHIRHDGISKKGGDKSFVDPKTFNASDWAKQWIDPQATPDGDGVRHILDSLGKEVEEVASRIKETIAKCDQAGQTIDQYRDSGQGESAQYKPEREKLHGEIMMDLLSPNKLRAAKPPAGENPKMIMLGGRGGSGKSWFKGKVYDPDTCVVLDADFIKSKLPEFQGWNANEVHEESSDILEQTLSLCIREGLNVVLDMTMKTASSAMAKVLRFKSAGFQTEAHYMHLPAQEAAKRAIYRFKDGGEKGPDGEPAEPYTGRFVPPQMVLKNTTNEGSFDQVRELVDNWSFRDNNVKRGEEPILISESEKSVKKSYAALVKNVLEMYN